MSIKIIPLTFFLTRENQFSFRFFRLSGSRLVPVRQYISSDINCHVPSFSAEETLLFRPVKRKNVNLTNEGLDDNFIHFIPAHEHQFNCYHLAFAMKMSFSLHEIETLKAWNMHTNQVWKEKSRKLLSGTFRWDQSVAHFQWGWNSSSPFSAEGERSEQSVRNFTMKIIWMQDTRLKDRMMTVTSWI